MIIAILAGGDSSEFTVSIKSAEQINSWLHKAGHTCYIVVIRKDSWKVTLEGIDYDVDKNIFGIRSGTKTIRFEFAWNIIHGTPGEDGKLQGYLDMMGIPYNCSGHLSSALTFNKYVCKTFLKQHQILTPEARLIRKGSPYDLEKLAEEVGLPCFVKPNSGGSSLGIAKVTRFETLQEAISIALREDNDVLIERFKMGTEVTCGLVKTKKETLIFPITEIVSKNEFFDYEAKYTKGMADEITPARISETFAKKCRTLASQIYDLTQSYGIIRVDFIIKGNQLYFLELNSIPGMSEESILPQQVECMGKDMHEILQLVVDDALD